MPLSADIQRLVEIHGADKLLALIAESQRPEWQLQAASRLITGVVDAGKVSQYGGSQVAFEKSQYSHGPRNQTTAESQGAHPGRCGAPPRHQPD